MDVAAEFDLALSGVSHHLRALRRTNPELSFFLPFSSQFFELSNDSAPAIPMIGEQAAPHRTWNRSGRGDSP